MDYDSADAIYEVLENRRTRAVWAVRWYDGKATGTLDITGEDTPEVHDLAALPYARPERGDAQTLEEDRDDWLVVRRFTRFVSAMPPQWVLDRQATTRRNTHDPAQKASGELDF